jgi:hypothetical protein
MRLEVGQSFVTWAKHRSLISSYCSALSQFPGDKEFVSRLIEGPKGDFIRVWRIK